MSLLDALFGAEPVDPAAVAAPDALAPTDLIPAEEDRDALGLADEEAVSRYLFFLLAASPDEVRAVQEEAFGQLHEEQREVLARQVALALPLLEAQNLRPDSRSLAAAVASAELVHPGVMERVLGGANLVGDPLHRHKTTASSPIDLAGGLAAAVPTYSAGIDTGHSLEGSLLGTIAQWALVSRPASEFYGQPEHAAAFDAWLAQQHEPPRLAGPDPLLPIAPAPD